MRNIRRIWNRYVGSNASGEKCIKCRGCLIKVEPLRSFFCDLSDLSLTISYYCDGCGKNYHRSNTDISDSIIFYDNQIEYMNRKH